MPKYYVQHSVVFHVTSTVRADSKEEAIQKVKDGEDNIDSKEYGYLLEEAPFYVEEVNAG